MNRYSETVSFVGARCIVPSVIPSAARNLLFLLFFFVLALPASAQGPATGTPPFGSFSGGPDIINNANLNDHWTFPVLHKPGRGIPFTYDLSYDSSMWYPVGVSGSQNWQPVGNWGWRGITEVAAGYISYTMTQEQTCYFNNQYYGIIYRYNNWTYHDTFGVAHYFSIGTYVVQPTGQFCSGSSSSATGTAADGSGWTLSATGSSPTSLTSAVGAAVSAPVNVTTGAGSFTDRNGNKITVNGSGQFFDTLSSATPVLTVAGSGTQTSPRTFTYTAPSGASTPYTVHYTNYTVATNFGVPGITGEYKSPAAVPLVSSIVLPDNSQYTFSYEPTPSLPAAHA